MHPREGTPPALQPAGAGLPRLPAAHLPSSDSAWESEKRPAKGGKRLPTSAQRRGRPPLRAGLQPLAPSRQVLERGPGQGPGPSGRT